MLQRDEPDDYVIATGVTRSVHELLETAFGTAGLDWRDHVVPDDTLRPPNDITELRGDPSKAARVLGWQPETSFEQLITMMVDADTALERPAT